MVRRAVLDHISACRANTKVSGLTESMDDDDPSVIADSKKGAWTPEVRRLAIRMLLASCRRTSLMLHHGSHSVHVQEDKLLTSRVSKLGTKSWTSVASGVIFRSAKSCRLRYVVRSKTYAAVAAYKTCHSSVSNWVAVVANRIDSSCT